MRKLLKRKINLFGKEISVFVVALLGMAVVSAALLSYYGQINQSVEIGQGVLFTGCGSGNVCEEIVMLNACESDESDEYGVESQTSVTVPLSIETAVAPDGQGVGATVEYNLVPTVACPDEDCEKRVYIDAKDIVGLETLSDLNLISWETYVSQGYPVHVDILISEFHVDIQKN